MPKCSRCEFDVELEYDDCVDTELTDDGKMLNTCTGYCPRCKRTFTWTDVYEFSHYENLREDHDPWEE